MNILMIHQNPCVRVLKEVSSLIKLGFRIDLLCEELTNHETLRSMVGRVYFYDSLFNLKKFLLKRYKNWDIIHCHNEPNDITAVAVDVCRERPVVYDVHDLSSARMPLSSFEAGIEEYCFKNCTAAIHVSEGLKRFAFQKYGPSLAIVLRSLPQVETIQFSKKNKLPGKHIVYQGGIVGSKNQKYCYRYYLPIFQKLAQAGVHVHAFPPPQVNWESLHEYIALAENPFFHLHDSLPYSELLEAMSQFQWGLSGFNFAGITSKDKLHFLNNAMPNKFFDYLLAGVCPVVINSAAVGEFATKNKLGYVAKDIEELVSICLEKEPLPPLENFDLIDMDNEIHKLKGLYVAALERKQTAPPLHSFLPTANKPNRQGVAFISALNRPNNAEVLELLMEYYSSGQWLLKEPDIYYSHTSADAHAYYLWALISEYRKSQSPATLLKMKQVGDLLLSLNCRFVGGNSGWGLGREYVNKLSPSRPTLDAATVYVYTSSIVANSLLELFEVTQDKKYFDACAAYVETLQHKIPVLKNGCIAYADHPSYGLDESFVPNMTALTMGFLAKYAKFDKTFSTEPIVAMYRSIMKLFKNGTFTYHHGPSEDLKHLSMMLDGFRLSSDITEFSEHAESRMLSTMVKMLFSGFTVKKSSVSFGTSNWGPAWALLMLHRTPGMEEYVLSGLEYLRDNITVMLYNIRTAGMYARLFSEVVHGDADR